MGDSTEKEIKYQLSQRDHRRLLRKLGKPRKIHRFRNVFFDTPDLWLHRHKIGLRVRLNTESASLTLKRSSKNSERKIAGFSVREEYESRISLPRAQKIVNGNLDLSTCRRTIPYQKLAQQLTSDKLAQLMPLGEIRTVRSVYHFESMILEMDQCLLFGKTFFELEIETAQPLEVRKKIRSLFRELAIPVKYGNLSKLGRFIREWKTVKN